MAVAYNIPDHGLKWYHPAGNVLNKGMIMSRELVDALVEAGVDLEELLEAVTEASEEASGGKGKKEKGGKGKKDKDEGKKEKGGKGKKGKKDEESVEDLIADLDDSELLALAVYMEFTTEKKGAKLDRDELEELFEDADAEEIAEGITEGITRTEDSDDEDPDYDDMSTEELVDLYVERKLGKKKAAEKMSDEELVDALEESDDD